MRLSDSKIVDGLKNEDSKTFSYLYKEVYPMVRKFILDNNGNEDDAKDIFQEVLIALIKNIRNPNFQLKSKISTYIYFITKKRWLYNLRHKRKSTVSFSEDDLIESQINNLEGKAEIIDFDSLYNIASIKIDKSWNLAEMGQFMINFNIMYQVKAAIILLKMLDSNEEIEKIITHQDNIRMFGDLRLLKVSYASPGSIDILGIGAILKEIREFIFASIEYKQNAKLKQIEYELLKEDLRTKRIQNVEKFLELQEKSNLPINTVNQLAEFIEPKKDGIVKLIKESKIKDIEIKPAANNG